MDLYTWNSSNKSIFDGRFEHVLGINLQNFAKNLSNFQNKKFFMQNFMFWVNMKIYFDHKTVKFAV